MKVLASYLNVNTDVFLRTTFLIVSALCMPSYCYYDESEGSEEYEPLNAFKLDYMRDDLPIFYSQAEVMKRLSKEAEREREKVQLINKTYHTGCRFGPDVDPPAGRRRPFIVVEGNHRHSRDVVGIKLARRMGGRLLKMPPKCLGMLSTTLAAASDLRRVFFGLSLYAAAYNVKQLLNIGIPVVMNGYWTDQAAFVLEKRFRKFPPLNHSLYHFPKDLFVPDMIIYLNKEETQVTDDGPPRDPPPWKQRTIDIYKRFQPEVVYVANMDPGFYKVVEEITQAMDDLLKDTRELSYNPPRYLDPRFF